MAEDGTQQEEFVDTEMEVDLVNKQSNGYANVDFDTTTMPMFDEATQTIVKSSGGSSSRKGIVRKLGSKSKNPSPRTSGNKKRNVSNDAVSKKSKKKRKSVIDNMTDDEEDSDFQL